MNLEREFSCGGGERFTVLGSRCEIAKVGARME